MNYDKAKLARHEAAHFVVGWAVECPALQADISEAAHKSGCLGLTFGYVGEPTPLEHVLISLAGPVADHWTEPNEEMLEAEKETIDLIVSDQADGTFRGVDYNDWHAVLGYMALCGVNVLDAKSRNDALTVYLDAVRSILETCGESWKETAELLIRQERIGFNGAHCDQGEEAYQLFARWENEDGEKPDDVTTCVERCLCAIRAAGA